MREHGLMALSAAAALSAASAMAATVTLPVEKVRSASDPMEKTFPGRVMAVQRVDVTPEVSGEITEVCFANGQLVKEGDLLYRIMPIKYKSALKNAQAKVEECRAKKAYAEGSAARYEKLAPGKAVSQDALESARSGRAVASAALEAAEAELAVAQYNLDRCDIKTPISGKTGTSSLTRGNPVSPSTPLVTVVQIQPIRVRFSISNADFLTLFGGKSRALKEQGEVSVTLANGTVFSEKGEVEYTENVADEATDTMRVYATFPNSERILRPGSTVGVVLRNKAGAVCAAVPPAAVMQDAEGASVWVVGADGRASRRRIAGARISGSDMLVTSGLKEGEIVVADGVHKVEEGDIVKTAPGR